MMELPLKILNHVKVIIFALILTLLVTVTTVLPVICLYIPLWTCVFLLGKYFRPDLDGPVSSFNAMFLFHKTTINCIGCIGFHGDIKSEDLIKRMQSRILSLRRPDGGFTYLGLKRFHTSFLGYAFWKQDPKFDIQNHVRDYDYSESLHLPTTVDADSLQQVLQGLVKAPWKESRSPWEMLLIRNFRSEGRSISMIILRFDHVLGDGFSMLELFRNLIDTEILIPSFNLGRRTLSFSQRLALPFKMIYDTAENILQAMTASKLDHQKKSTQLSSCKPKVLVTFTPKISVQRIKAIKNHFKVSYGAVIYALYLGALERALKSCGQLVPERLATNFLMPKPNHPGGLCVHSYSILATWPLRSRSSLNRLLEVQKSFNSTSRSGAAYIMDLFILSGVFYPTRVRTAVSKLTFALMNQSIYLTTMPVTTSPDYFFGFENVEIIPINDTVPAFDVGMGVTTGGCNNSLRFSFTINAGFFASDDVAGNMTTFIFEELQAFEDAMGK